MCFLMEDFNVKLIVKSGCVNWITLNIWNLFRENLFLQIKE